jgi:hypothetical protein
MRVSDVDSEETPAALARPQLSRKSKKNLTPILYLGNITLQTRLAERS